MKIVYLSVSTVPSTAANSIHVMKMCQAFAQESHDVSLVVISQKTGAVNIMNKDLWKHYGVRHPFNIRMFKQYRILKLYDFNIHSAHYAKKVNCDLVYARNLGAAAYAANKGIPTILECHSPLLDTWRQKTEFLRLLRAPGFRRLVVITHALSNHYLEKYSEHLNDNIVVVAPDAVDLERFDSIPDVTKARKKCGLTECFTVGYAGHLYPGRGIELIYSMAEKLPSVQFLIIGGLQSDVKRHSLEAQHRRLRNIVFKGFIENQYLPRCLAACDVLLMPYQKIISVHGHSTKEFINTAPWSSPMKMFEYMAMKRLIISSDLPVLREVLNETNSVLCDPEDIGQWIDAVIRAQTDTEWTGSLSEKAFTGVQSFTWRKRVRKVLDSINL